MVENIEECLDKARWKYIGAAREYTESRSSLSLTQMELERRKVRIEELKIEVEIAKNNELQALKELSEIGLMLTE